MVVDVTFSGSLGLVRRRSVIGGTAHADRAIVKRVMQCAPAAGRALHLKALRDHARGELCTVGGRVAGWAADGTLNLESRGGDVDASPEFFEATGAEHRSEQGSTVDGRDGDGADDEREGRAGFHSWQKQTPKVFFVGGGLGRDWRR